MISEKKKEIVINNYFDKECNIDTSIREAYKKGFERGLEKGAQVTKKQAHWNYAPDGEPRCSHCGYKVEEPEGFDFCPKCGYEIKW